MKKTMSRRKTLPIGKVVWLGLAIVLLAGSPTGTFAQAPSASPPDKRGLGLETAVAPNNSQADQKSREAKPELVLQTGYNNFFGATRIVFSPDGRLIATATFRSSTIKLWETATGRELRDLSSGTQSAMSMSPFVAFSRDGRLIAAAAGSNSAKIWDVTSGRELQTLSGPEGSMSASLGGMYFIGFTSNGRVVTISDAIRVWDVATGRELQTVASTSLNIAAFSGGGGGAALSPDGNQLATIITDGERPQIKFWDLGSGSEARSVDLPDKEINSPELSFAADGRLLVSGIVDKRLKLWDVASKGNGMERELAPTTKDYSLVKFSRDGRLLALSEGYSIRLWETATGRELPPLKLPNSGIFAGGNAFVSFSDDGKRVATGGFDTPTILWETETGKQILSMNGRTNMAYKVAFSADGTRLSSGGRTRWDLRTGRGVRITSAPADNSRFGVPSPDGRLLATFSPNSNIVSILETPAGRQVQTLTPAGGGGGVQRAVFSPDGTMLATSYGATTEQLQNPLSANQASSNMNQIKIWDVKSGRELRSLPVANGAAEVGFSADGRLLATLGALGKISLWDTASGNKLRDLTSSPMERLSAMGSMGNPGAMPDPGSLGNMGAQMGKAGKQGTMPQFPNMADMTAVVTNMMGAMSAGTMGRTVTSVAFSPDGRTLATGGVESKSNLDLAALSGAPQKGQKKNSAKPTDPEEMMKNIKFEAIGQVVLWDVATGREIGALKGHGKGVTQVAFSRDGRLLASSSTDNTIRIWDVATQRELRTLTGHSSNIDSLDFSPDSSLLASAGDDGGTFLWDANTGEHLLTLISLDDGGEWMVVTPQGLFDGTPVSWNQILWRYNQDTFNVAPIEWFFNEFYYPGLLGDILAGKRPRVAQDVSKKDRRQPIVKLSLTGEGAGGAGAASDISSRTVRVRIDVTDAPADKDNPQGSGARDVRLFRNGSLVRVWHGDVLNGKPAVTLEDEITVAAGANRLTAYAFNKDNVKSKDAQLPLTGA
ncbi:MAG TPA: WD40 repeat domain-containing protein, partial [Pyrinomonadaceae bacterium]